MRTMRRKDRQISVKESRQLLNHQGVGVLSTVDAEGQPYGVPVNYVLQGEALYFHCSLEGHKLDNIRESNRVCFTVCGESKVIPEQFTTHFASVVVFGTAVIVDGEEKLDALKLIVERFSPDFVDEGLEYIRGGAGKTAVVRIDIKQVTGKRAGLGQ